MNLAHLPTPLEPLPRLGARLGIDDLWVKRDDLTGLALGGNKARKLELLLADALEQGDFVLAVENGQLVRKPVGAVRTWSRGELVEVKGLEAGLRIVSAPLPGLKAGQRVKVIETP